MTENTALALGVVLIAMPMLPRAFRLITFGAAFSLDVVLKAWVCRRVRSDEPHAFLTCEIAGVPARTYGRLKRDGSGHLLFVYRPYLIFPKRAVIIPQGRVAVATGALLPALVHSAAGQDRHTILAHLLPRYRSYESIVLAHLTVGDA